MFSEISEAQRKCRYLFAYSIEIQLRKNASLQYSHISKGADNDIWFIP